MGTEISLTSFPTQTEAPARIRLNKSEIINWPTVYCPNRFKLLKNNELRTNKSCHDLRNAPFDKKRN